MYFAELRTFPGPQEIAVTGDNSFETLLGREWAILFCDDGTWHTLQWADDDDLDPGEGITSRGWRSLTDPLLSLPPLTAGAERRWTAAFDQNARLIVAYERAGTIEVTRWDSPLGAYRQNVSFAGHDPHVLNDMAVTDPRGYPNLDDDGWSVREAYDAGIPVLFEWLPDLTYRRSALADSDVLLFYLSADRTTVLCRVQRETYGTARVIHDFGTPVVLDHALALPGRYQLLVSNAVGVRLPQMLVSDPYLGDFLINPRPVEVLSINVAPESLRSEADTMKVEDGDALPSGVTPEPVNAERVIYLAPGSESVAGALAPEPLTAIAMLHREITSDDSDASVTPEIVSVVAVIALMEADDDLTAAISPERVRVQAV